MALNCMIDLETLGLTPGSVVLSIGAVLFDPALKPEERPASQPTFEIRIDVLSSLMAGLTVDPGTVTWWRSQSERARSMLTAGRSVSLTTAVDRFAGWWETHQPEAVWGNGPDVAWWEAVCRAAERPYPWSHRQIRDQRTLVEIAERLGFDRDSVPFRGTEHDALDDARHQAEVVLGASDVLLAGWRQS